MQTDYNELVENFIIVKWRRPNKANNETIEYHTDEDQRAWWMDTSLTPS